MRPMRRLLVLVSALLPWPLKRRVLVAVGWDVDPTARIGVSFLDVADVRLGPGARIGHLNLVRRVKVLEMGPRAQLGSLNHIVGPRTVAIADRVDTVAWPSRLVLGADAIVFNQNFLDVSGEIRLEDRAMLAGGFSRVWSHGPTPPGPDGVRGLRPAVVVVGEDVYVGAGSTLLPDSVIAAGCTIGAASVVTRSAGETPGAVLVGNPARPLAADNASERPRRDDAAVPPNSDPRPTTT